MNTKSCLPFAPIVLALGCATTDVTFEKDPANWPQFRGPGGLAVAEGPAIPSDLGPESHVLWRADVPNGHSSPCIWGDVIVVTGNEESGTDVVVALDKSTGEELWKRFFEGEAAAMYAHADAGPALPSPCTDGERVIAYLGGYGVVALDFDGELLWEHRMPHPGYMFGVGTSPLLYDGKVYVMRDGAPEAAILALDANDGSELWKIDRFDFGESHGSPFLWQNADRDELVIGGTRRLCSFDPQTGEPLWTVDGVTVFPCTTPTADADTLYFAAWSTPNATGRSFWDAGFGRSLELSDDEIADPTLLFARLDANGDGVVLPDEVPECRAKDAFGFLDANRNGTWEAEELVAVGEPSEAPGKNIMVAVERGGSGDVTASHVRWSWTRGLPYVSSPLLHRGRLWLFKAGGVVTCLDAATGKPIFDRERLEDRSEYYVSPVGAGDFIIAGSAEGTFYLLDANADDLSVVHTVEFDEELFATPAILEGTMYLRTTGTMWAFGEG